MTWKERYGLFKSWLIYYGKPGNRSRLKNFYRQFIEQGDLCFDIGSHLGNRSRAFLDLDCQVVALEPQPLFADFLDRKFGANKDFNLVRAAIGPKAQKMKMHISSSNPTITTLADKEWRDMMNSYESIHTKWDQEIEVDVVSIDDLIKKYGKPKFIKLDVEGFEAEAIRGLSQPVEFISFEFIGADAQRTIHCVELLQSIGTYEFNISMVESQKMEWKEWRDSTQTIEVLQGFGKHIPSGDVYARLVNR